MKKLVIFAIIIVVWLLFAQSCMTFRIKDAAAAKKFKEAGVEISFHNLKTGAHTLHFAETGSDQLPTIVFVHGSPGSWDAFQDYLKDADLLKKFRLISIDRPGFGYSDFGTGFHLADQSAIISPLFKYIANGQPIYLVGHSLGGPMAFKLAADNPGLFSSLVILAGSQDPAAEKPEKWRPVLFKTPLNYLVPGALRPSNEELWYLKKDLVDLKTDLQKISCTVYLLHGTKDVLVPFSNMAYTKKMLTHASAVKSIVFENENHFLPWKRFTEVKKLLLDLY